MLISPRLLPAVEIGDATISIEMTQKTDNRGASKWRYYIDGPDFEHSGQDLSGWEGHRGMLETLLAFLSAAAEAKEYEDRTGRKAENSDLFPPVVLEWAVDNRSYIDIMQAELSR